MKKRSLVWCTAILLAVLCALGSSAEPAPSVEETREDSARGTSKGKAAFDSESLGEAWERASENSQRKTLPATTQASSQPLEFGSVLSQIALSLLVIVGGIYGVSFLLKRFLGPTLHGSVGPLKILAKQSLSQKSSVYIVATFDRFLVIGESAQGLTCLCEFDDPEKNRMLQEQWGWDWGSPAEKNSLFSPKTSPFNPSLQSHVSELERELERMKEVS